MTNWTPCQICYDSEFWDRNVHVVPSCRTAFIPFTRFLCLVLLNLLKFDYFLQVLRLSDCLRPVIRSLHDDGEYSLYSSKLLYFQKLNKH
jgi:hypothetical protein